MALGPPPLPAVVVSTRRAHRVSRGHTARRIEGIQTVQNRLDRERAIGRFLQGKDVDRLVITGQDFFSNPLEHTAVRHTSAAGGSNQTRERRGCANVVLNVVGNDAQSLSLGGRQAATPQATKKTRQLRKMRVVIDLTKGNFSMESPRRECMATERDGCGNNRPGTLVAAPMIEVIGDGADRVGDGENVGEVRRVTAAGSGTELQPRWCGRVPSSR